MRLLIVILFFSFGINAQIGTGQWRLHIPSKAVDVVAQSDRVFVAYEKGVGEYGYSSNELSFWDAVNSLSDITITVLGDCQSDNSVFVGYDNGNIDKIKNNAVINIPAIKLAQVQGSKSIHKMVEHENHMYIATGFAIVKIDPVKNEVRDTYYPTNGNEAIYDVAFKGDSIYALTADRMYRGDLNNPALPDAAQWIEDSRLPVITSDAYTDLEIVNDEIYILRVNPAYGGDTVLHILGTGTEVVADPGFSAEIYSLTTLSDGLSVNMASGTRIYNNAMVLQESLEFYAGSAFPNPQNVSQNGDEYWIADRTYGLMRYMGDFNTQNISYSGPPKSDFYAMDGNRGKMVFAAGGLTGQNAVTYNRSGIYVFDEEQWTLHDRTTDHEWDVVGAFDFLCASINPNDENQIAVGAYSSVPLTVLDETGVVDTFTTENSIIEPTSLGNGSTLISDLQYDDQGNLWMVNGYCNEPLKVYTKDGEWYSFNLGTVAKSKFTRKVAIDYNGNKWLAVKGAGLFGLKDQGTISTLSDDEVVNLNVGESTGALPSNEVQAIAVDFDNEIWIGTDNGFAVLYNSDGAFGAGYGDYNAQRIKLEFEGNVEYVLGATNITDIEVDGANRKWFGTANSGVILLSADGLEILEHHTVENSPLISNTIVDLQFDHTTGELYVITDQGLISYRTDASYEDPNYESVSVFPNPARPEFGGPITIQGIRYDSDVKITDVAGNLVYQTTSNGGTATWDGKTLQGERVKTGVYLIRTAANQGKGRQVGKVLVVN